MAKNKLNAKVLENLPVLNTKLFQVISNYFPDIKQLLKKTDDRRHQSYIVYTREYIHMIMILSFIFRNQSSRLIMIDLLGEKSVDNLNSFFETELETLIHETTVAYFYNYDGYCADQLLKVPAELIRNIIRRKTFEQFRLLDKWYTIALDGTGIISFNKPHCDKCLTMAKDGKTIYYHNVLTAQLVIWTGYAFPIALEFIENSGNTKESKQDSEYKAFFRMLPNIKKYFPQERFCFLLDGLFTDSVIISCIENLNRFGMDNYKYIIALKDDDLKSVNEDFEGLCKITKNNTIQASGQSIRFINNMTFKGQTFSVIESTEKHTSPNAKSPMLKLKHITNIQVNQNNALIIMNQGGRQRSVIENQGYNVLKNGYNLKHPFRIDSLEAIKSVFCLACIAYIIFQFFTVALFGSKQLAKELFRAIKVLADKLKQSFCKNSLGNFLLPMRISFNSS